MEHSRLEGHENGPAHQKRRILSIDGGGILGVFPASFLAEIEQHLDYPIGRYFDLIAGTSTGGIIGIALALGHSAKEILQLYEKNGPSIFGQNRGVIGNFLCRKIHSIRQWYRHKYDSDALQIALHDVLGDRQLGHATSRLVIPAWNSDVRSVYIYKTAHHPRLRTDYRSRALDVALATAAAPTYFRQHITQHDACLLDGGIWANNPIAIAAVEAIAMLGWPRDCLHILSIGCLDKTYTIPKSLGLGRLRAKAISLLMDGQSHGAMGMAKLLTKHEHERKAVYRIDHTVSHGSYKMDDIRKIRELKGLGHTIGRDRLPVLKSVFFDQPAEKFTPNNRLEEKYHGD